MPTYDLPATKGDIILGIAVGWILLIVGVVMILFGLMSEELRWMMLPGFVAPMVAFTVLLFSYGAIEGSKKYWKW